MIDISKWQRATWSMDIEDGARVAIVNGSLMVMSPTKPVRYVLVTEDYRPFTHPVQLAMAAHPDEEYE